MRWFRLGLLIAMIPAARAAEIHVSPDGNDGNPGTAAKPLATVTAAQRAARAAAGKPPVTVWLHRGIYHLPGPLCFTAEDSGCTYAAAPGESVVLSGAKKLSLQWTPFRNGIMQAKTPPGLVIDRLFVNGQLEWMARYPNYNAAALPFGGVAADAFSRERAARWKDPAGGFIHALHKGGWGGMHYRITGKETNGEVTYEGGWQNNRPSPPHPKNRFVENIFEELDAPGEWYHDGKAGILYFQPPANVDLPHAEIEAAGLRQLVEITGSRDKPVRKLVLRGLVFRHTARTFMETKEPLLRSDWTIYRGGAVVFTGAEDCAVEDCDFDRPGGNAVFLNQYNRRVVIRRCDIHDAGASGVAFVGDPQAVRNPLFHYGQTQAYAKIDKTPGPKTENFPGDCTVEDCLIRGIGTIEKQAAGVQISMSMGITVRHCSIYEASRAGINIGDGCWGGHLIEYCDVFDTIRETGDHGSFNAWGRDRYWKLGGAPAAELPALALLDTVKPIILRNNRWRADHGWDVDLDDGATNYQIYNNLFLKGGLKLREGFERKVWNNIAVNNSLHPHVWFENSGDEVTRNIWMGAYRPAIMHPQKWGREVDRNAFTGPDADRTKFADKGCDAHSLTGDPLFMNPAQGDYRVKDGSPVLKLGFVNFPMDQFGVRAPRLRSLARTPLAAAANPADSAPPTTKLGPPWRGALLRDWQGDEYSAIGVPADAHGLLVTQVADKSPAATDGLRASDFIERVNGREVRDVNGFLATLAQTAKDPVVTLTLVRDQQAATCRIHLEAARADHAPDR